MILNPKSSPATDDIPAGKLSVLNPEARGCLPAPGGTLTEIMGAINGEYTVQDWKFEAECVCCPCWLRRGTFQFLPATGATVDIGRRPSLLASTEGPLVDQEGTVFNQSPSYRRADELYSVVSDSLGDGYPVSPSY